MEKLGKLLDEQEIQLQSLSPSISTEDKISELKGLRHHLVKGSFEAIDNSTGRKKSYKFDGKLAEKYIHRYTQYINDLKRQLESQRSLSGWEPATAMEAINGIFAVSRKGEYSLNPESYKTVYESLPKDEQEVFRKLVKEEIRDVIASLERESADNWIPGHLRTKERQLGNWLEYLHTLNSDEWEAMSHEEESRRWHHRLIKTMETGSSPMDTKRLLEAQQEFDKNRFLEAIADVPGVDRGVQLIEEDWDGYFRSETAPDAREAWKKGIIQRLETEGVCVDGITPGVAYELSMRHLRVFGREGMMYNEFIEKHDLIKIRKEDGVWKAFVDRNTPLTWDPMRLIYCPKAMWIYFGFGGNEAGQTVSFRTLDGKTMGATGGVGVGADVMKVLFDSGLDFRIQDFYSRRKPHMLDAWISEQLEKPGARPDDRAAWNAYLEELKNDKYDPATGVITRRGDPLLATVYELQLKVIKAEYNVRFAHHFGEQVWETPNGAEILKQVQKLRGKAGARPDILATLDRIERDFPGIVTETNRINTAIDPNWKTNPKFKDYFKSMANFHIKDIPYLRLPRLQEAVRGNFRDTFTALTIYTAFGDFINNPTPENLMKIPVAQAKGYTSLADIQARMVVPAYNALVAVQRGRGPFGFDFGLGFLRSKYGLVRDVVSLDDLNLYKLSRWMVTNEYLSKDMARALRGGLKGWLRDKTLQHADPMMLGVLFMGMVQKELENIGKEMQKES